MENILPRFRVPSIIRILFRKICFRGNISLRRGKVESRVDRYDVEDASSLETVRINRTRTEREVNDAR